MEDARVEYRLISKGEHRERVKKDLSGVLREGVFLWACLEQGEGR